MPLPNLHSVTANGCIIANNLISTYTPGFIVDGREWRGWFRGKSLEGAQFSGEPGVLKATIEGEQVAVEFSPKTASGNASGQKEIHWALLGFDYKAANSRR